MYVPIKYAPKKKFTFKMEAKLTGLAKVTHRRGMTIKYRKMNVGSVDGDYRTFYKVWLYIQDGNSWRNCCLNAEFGTLDEAKIYHGANIETIFKQYVLIGES